MLAGVHDDTARSPRTARVAAAAAVAVGETPGKLEAPPVVTGPDIAAAITAATATTTNQANQMDESCMDYGTIRGLGDKRVSRVVYGTLFLHSVADPTTLLDAVYGFGCNAFDCAAIYGAGKCEAVLGDWLAHRNIDRTKLVIITKGGCQGQDKLWSANLEADYIRTSLQQSLERLKLDFVDVFLLHRDDPSKSVAEIVDTMDGLRAEGLFPVWGVSNWDLERLQAAIAYANANGKEAPTCDSLQFSLAQPTRPVWPDTKYMRPEAQAWYHGSGVSVLAWECLAKGFMTGKWDRIADGDRAEKVRLTRRPSQHSPVGESSNEWRDERLIAAYCCDPNFDRRDRAELLATKKGLSMAQIALKYVVSQPFQCFVLVGTRNPDHFGENARGGSPNKLTPQELRWLETGEGGVDALASRE